MIKKLNLVIAGMMVLMGSAFQKDVHAQEREAPAYAPMGNIQDMVLIYDGGVHRKVWDEERFKPYVYAPKKVGGGADWLFDGFLFLEINDGNNYGYATGYTKVAATKENWEDLLSGYFKPGQSIHALDDCIEQAKTLCGKLPQKRKIVLALPEPIRNQKNWGALNGKALDFSTDEDRIAACQWYIDLIKKHFKKAKLKNVELSGFYWLAEEDTHTRTFVKTIAEHIHRNKQRFYWIPYFKSDGFNTWKELGFDQAYLQPNYFFNNNVPDTRVDETCQLAKAYGMSLEMEFDERAATDAEKERRYNGYLDGFVKNGVFENTAVAYYVGEDGMNALWKGDDRQKALYYKMTDIIVERKNKK